MAAKHSQLRFQNTYYGWNIEQQFVCYEFSWAMSFPAIRRFFMHFVESTKRSLHVRLTFCLKNWKQKHFCHKKVLLNARNDSPIMLFTFIRWSESIEIASTHQTFSLIISSEWKAEFCEKKNKNYYKLYEPSALNDFILSPNERVHSPAQLLALLFLCLLFVLLLCSTAF